MLWWKCQDSYILYYISYRLLLIDSPLVGEGQGSPAKSTHGYSEKTVCRCDPSETQLLFQLASLWLASQLACRLKTQMTDYSVTLLSVNQTHPVVEQRDGVKHCTGSTEVRGITFTYIHLECVHLQCSSDIHLYQCLWSFINIPNPTKLLVLLAASGYRS